MQGDMGGCREMQGDTGRHREGAGAPGRGRGRVRVRELGVGVGVGLEGARRARVEWQGGRVLGC